MNKAFCVNTKSGANVQISARSAISVIYLSVLLIHHSVSGMLKVLRFL